MPVVRLRRRVVLAALPCYRYDTVGTSMETKVDRIIVLSSFGKTLRRLDVWNGQTA